MNGMDSVGILIALCFLVFLVLHVNDINITPLKSPMSTQIFEWYMNISTLFKTQST